MKDPADHQTPDLIEPPKTKAQRFREKQAAAGLSQYAFWLSPTEASKVKAFIEKNIIGKRP